MCVDALWDTKPTNVSACTFARRYRKRLRAPLGEGVIKRWAWQILEGLVYLHGHDPPIVHRCLHGAFTRVVQGVVGACGCWPVLGGVGEHCAAEAGLRVARSSPRARVQHADQECLCPALAPPYPLGTSNVTTSLSTAPWVRRGMKIGRFFCALRNARRGG